MEPFLKMTLTDWRDHFVEALVWVQPVMVLKQRLWVGIEITSRAASCCSIGQVTAALFVLLAGQLRSVYCWSSSVVETA